MIGERPAAGERARLLAAYDVAGATERGEMVDLVEFAAEICDAPVALVTAVDEERQHFIARRGTELDGTDRSISFCNHALDGGGVLEVPDAVRDPRFADNPLVTGDAHIRFYAGAPMVTPDGLVLGTVCVLDTEPRAGLTPLQRRGLEIVAKAAMARLDERRAQRERETARARSRAALAESDLRFRTLADTMPQMVWSTLPDGFHDYYNARWYEFTGVPEGSTDGEAWNGMFHEGDRERAWTAWRHSLETGEPYEIEYRLRHHAGGYRWVLGRALPIRDEAGAITRWFGTCTDIHEQRTLMEQREVVAHELSHRIKNIFAVVSGLVTLAAKHRPALADAAADLRQRITALGRAHDFVRPHSPRSQGEGARPDSLHGLLAELFAPYARVRIEGVDLPVDDRAATPLALLFHELATNAAKYGALSTERGEVVVRVEPQDAAVRLTWTERGGPPVTAPPEQAGFGTHLVELSAVRQLGGDLGRDWARDGLKVELTVPRAALSRARA